MLYLAFKLSKGKRATHSIMASSNLFYFCHVNFYDRHMVQYVKYILQKLLLRSCPFVRFAASVSLSLSLLALVAVSTTCRNGCVCVFIPVACLAIFASAAVSHRTQPWLENAKFIFIALIYTFYLNIYFMLMPTLKIFRWFFLLIGF